MLKRNNILTLVKEKVISLKEAALRLNLSYRQAKRLMDRFRTSGLSGLGFQREHPAPNKLAQSVVGQVISLRRNGYKDYNLSHFTEVLHELGTNVSRETVRNILLASGDYRPLEGRKKKPRTRFEAPQAGLLAQMDTSPHRWVPALDKNLPLIAIIDDHSRKILAAGLFEKDTAYNNMLVLKEAIRKHGLFHTLYTDNDSKFNYIRTQTSLYFDYHRRPEDVDTQIHRALNELGIRLTHTPSFEPYGRGKIERLFGFMQDRVPKGIAKRELKTMELDNAYIKEWIIWYNRYRTHRATHMTPEDRAVNNVFMPIPKGINLEDVFSIVVERIVRSDNTFDYKGHSYQLDPKLGRINWTKAKIELRIHPDRYIRVFYQKKIRSGFQI